MNSNIYKTCNFIFFLNQLYGIVFKQTKKYMAYGHDILSCNRNFNSKEYIILNHFYL